MYRFSPLDPAAAAAPAAEILEQIESRLGMVPNLLRVLAHSPAALAAYRGLDTALARGTLSPTLRERIALTVAEANECEYCLAAHTATGKALGLSDEQVVDSRVGTSPDSKVDAVLRFVREIVESRGKVGEASLQRLEDVGFSTAEVAEIVANVALHIFLNYFDHVVKPPIDFPKAAALSSQRA